MPTVGYSWKLQSSDSLKKRVLGNTKSREETKIKDATGIWSLWNPQLQQILNTAQLLKQINRKPHINGLFHSLIIWYIMSSFQQTTTSHAKSQEKTLPEETKQASETDSDMTQLLERSEKASHALPRLIPLVISWDLPFHKSWLRSEALIITK